MITTAVVALVLFAPIVLAEDVDSGSMSVDDGACSAASSSGTASGANEQVRFIAGYLFDELGDPWEDRPTFRLDISIAVPSDADPIDDRHAKKTIPDTFGVSDNTQSELVVTFPSDQFTADGTYTATVTVTATLEKREWNKQQDFVEHCTDTDSGTWTIDYETTSDDSPLDIIIDP